MPLSFSRSPLRRAPQRRNTAPLLLGLSILLLVIYYARRKIIDIDTPQLRKYEVPSSSNHAQGGELLNVYELPPSHATEPAHLTPVDPTTLVPKGTHPIDVAHRNGYLHTGHILYIMDDSGSLLFLQRTPGVVTCPSTWSLLGEHANANESPRETVLRALEEELGFVGLNFDDFKNAGAFTAELHPSHNLKNSLTVTINTVTDLPLYYIRHYGPRNDDRIDRQLTYLWVVNFPKKHAEIDWKFDDEVADHKWVTLEEAASWLSGDGRNGKEDGEAKGGTGSDSAKEYGSDWKEVKDDGPDEGEFCHHTIRSLYEVGLSHMI
eukprot:CAMPEP_0183732532 /NCGR_PEP_ID=MMETSP0737-20130205/38659_1 /TAXON_ID=385413 /ORGANISM="Thalassiosira miniscula, Strain CCMP1093" /LENGTH=320 /DNA_ID=CAMNT_0025965561 /DNA_START=15 /DNA_END=977 /DNA_ORIENTATION=-